MAKVTSKLQVTIPKRIAEAFGIEPGDEIEFVAASEWIRVIPPRRVARGAAIGVEERLHWFDAATARQREREQRAGPAPRDGGGDAGRGWTRLELYERDGSG